MVTSIDMEQTSSESIIPVTRFSLAREMRFVAITTKGGKMAILSGTLVTTNILLARSIRVG